MPRYGDLDKLSEQITTNHCSACGIYNGEMCCSCPMNDALRYIDEFPKADVAPRAEVDLYKGLNDELEDELASIYDKLENARAEVAREIFEEIEQEINAALQSNYKVLPQIEQSESLWNRVNGKIDALRGIDSFIAQLKNKYTEGI